ncbi:MAG: hydrogenase expression/formation protein [Nitrospiraceae bacterium]|nr:MAG: hydrogenase expression/formation protein [Nitrospiraceae bacterium]
MYLRPGKLPLDILEKFLKSYTSSRHGVIVGPSIGEDAAAIDMGDTYLLAKTDPITFVAEDIGTYTIHINANDIATMGGTPRWFLATVLLPENSTTEELAEKVFRQLSAACSKIDVSWCGGHTEITRGIDRPIVIGMMLGEVGKSRLITTSGAQVGDDIILTKEIAIEGTSVIAREKGEELKGIFGERFVEKCRNLMDNPGISVLEDAEIAVRNGDIHSMHDPTEGGIATGLYEIAKAAGTGLLVEEEKIPVLEECRTLCRHYNLAPLGLIASGSLLITLNPKDTEVVIESLKKRGLTACQIGKIHRRDEGVKIRKGDKSRGLERFEADEITKIFR